MSVDERTQYELGWQDGEPLLNSQRADDRGPLTTRRAVSEWVDSYRGVYTIETLEQMLQTKSCGERFSSILGGNFFNRFLFTSVWFF